MTTPDSNQELRDLIAGYWHGNLSAEQALRVNELLARDPDAMAMFARYSVLRSLLELESGFKDPADLSSAATTAAAGVSPSLHMGEGSATSSPSPLMGEGRGEGSSTAPVPAKPTKSPVLGFLGGVVDYVSHSRTLMFCLISGALGLYFVVQLGSLIVSRFWAQNAPQLAGADQAAPHETQSIGGHDFAGVKEEAVARLTNTIESKWQFGDGRDGVHKEATALEIGAEFAAGQQLNLTAGLAELTFTSGAKVILHAPVQFAVSNAMSGELQIGKLTAKVPHTAAGFTVATPGGKVVDLGTEFGVKVNYDRTMHVIVYVGEVEVKRGAGTGSSAGAGQSVKVKAGEAVVVTPGQPVKSTPPADERFIRDLTPLGGKQQSEAEYVAFMKKLKPVVWFRMEGKETDRVLHNEAGGPDAKLSWDGPGNPFTKGAVGKALWLRGPMLGDGATLADYPKAEHGKLSVAAWVYAESRPAWATIAKNWGRVEQGQFGFSLYGDTASNDLCVLLGGDKGEVREGADHPFPLNQWQHVAFTCDGATLRLYRQGREVASSKVQGLMFPTTIHPLGIGVKMSDSGGAGPYGWDGKLDEVALFNEVLSAIDIRNLANAPPR